MRIKRVLLATTALALLAGAGQAQAGDLYISVLGGANWVADESAVTTGLSTGFASDADTGFLLGAAIGMPLDKWAKGLRVELEASYRRNDVGGSWFTNANPPTSTSTTGGFIDGNMSNFALMANLWYDIDIGSKWRPYIGAGAGWARSKVDVAFLTTFTSGGPTTGLNETNLIENDGFAWQVGLGFNYEVMPDVDVGVGYRYFDGPNTDDFFEGKSQLRLNNENHSVFVNLTIGIN